VRICSIVIFDPHYLGHVLCQIPINTMENSELSIPKPHYLGERLAGVYIHWTGLLNWNNGLNYWTDIISLLHTLWLVN